MLVTFDFVFENTRFIWIKVDLYLQMNYVLLDDGVNVHRNQKYKERKEAKHERWHSSRWVS